MIREKNTTTVTIFIRHNNSFVVSNPITTNILKTKLKYNHEIWGGNNKKKNKHKNSTV